MAIKSFLSEGGFSVGSVGSAPIEVIDSSGNITAVGLTVSGNLVVNGSTTTINSTTTTLDDPIFTLGGDTVPTSDDNKDRGIEFRWHDGSLAKVGFFGFDDSTGKFVFIPNATNTSEVFSGTKGTIDANLEWADVLSKPSPVVTVILQGDVSGSASATLTSLGNGTITINTTVNSDAVALGTDTTGNYVASITNGSYITGGNGGSEGAALTLAVDATSANTASKVVARDASGNFSAGVITGTRLESTNSGIAQLYINSTTNGSKEIVFQNNGSTTGYVWQSGSYVGLGGGSGSNSIFVNSGQLGIGTTSPAYKTEVLAAAAAYWNGTAFTAGPLALAITNSSAGGYDPVLMFRQADSAGTLTDSASIGMVGKAAWTAGSASTQISDMYFLLRNTASTLVERMRLTNDGALGIGISAPAAALHVARTGADEQLILGSAATNRDISMAMYSGTTKAEVLRFQSSYRLMLGNASSITQQSFFTSGTERLVITSGGNVGIGVSPGTRLNVKEENSGTEGFIVTNWNGVNTVLAGSDSISGGGKFTLKTNAGTSAVFISSAASSYFNGGSVGVGVSSPSAKLHVSEASGVGNFAALKLTNTVTSVNANVDIIMEAGGQVGARIRAIAPGASHNDLAMYVTNSGTLQATPAIFIQGSTNRVGINRSDPSNTLDVNGSVRTTDWYYVENSGNGMYNNANAMWWASHGSGSYSLSSNTTFSGIKLFSGGSQNTFRGHFYGDADGQGFLNSAGNWSLRLDSSSRLIAYSGIANMNAGIRISMPGGAAYSTQLSTVTGAFKIKLPTGRYKSDSMLRMTIKIYQYSTGQSLTFNVGGYNYNHATNTWLNIFAEQESDSNATVYTVRFGDDGTSNCIWIGETNSTWSYPQVFVSEFEAGYSGTTIDWASGWTISAVTAFDTVYASRTSAVKVTSNNIGTYGVSSITGTANQVTASASTGAVTLSLPQNIHTAATPTFSSLTLSGDVMTLSGSGVTAYATNAARIYNQSGVGVTVNANTFEVRTGTSSAFLALSVSNTQNTTLAGNLTVSGTGTSSFAGSVNVDGGINFLRGSGEYSTYIKASDYIDAGYNSSTLRYWIELGAKGGTHIVLNTDGSATAAENSYDHFTIWQYTNGSGAIAAGARKFWITNTGRVNFIDSVWHKSSDGIERIHFGSSGTTFYKGGGTGAIHTFRNASDVDILTLNNAKDATLAGNLTVSGTGTSSVGGAFNIGANCYVPNANFYRGKNAAGSSDYRLIGVTSGNVVSIDADATGATFGGNITVSGGSTTVDSGSSGIVTVGYATALSSSNQGNSAIGVVGRNLRASSTNDDLLILKTNGAIGAQGVVFKTGTIELYTVSGSVTAGNVLSSGLAATFTTATSTIAGNLTVSGTGTSTFAGKLTVNGGTATIDAISADSPMPGTSNATLNIVGRSSGAAKTASIIANTAGSLLLSAEGAGSALTIAANTGNTTVAYNLTVNGTGKQTLGQSVNATVYAGNTSTTDQAIILSNTRRANYGDVMIAKNLEGVASADSYATPATSAATGYAAVEMRYGGVVRVYGNSGATTAAAVVSPNVLAEFTPTAIGLNLNTTVTGNLTVSGNLIINGTTTTVNSTTTTLDDPIITLGGDTAPTVDDNKDRGVEFRWHNGTVAKTGFFGYDDSTGYFTFIPDATNTSEVFSGTKGTIDANLVGNVTGNVSGSAGSLVGTLTAGTYLTGGSFNGSTNVTFAVDATSANTASKVVARDANGSFSAGASNFIGPATTTAYALRVAKGNYADSGGHTTFLGFGAETTSWSKGAIGWTRTGSYDTGQLGFFINTGTADTNSAATSDLKMVILGNGNVGIGLAFGTAPGYKLEVSGNGYFSGALSSGGTITGTSFSGPLANTLTLNTNSGAGLSGSATFNNSGAATFTVTSNATSVNTASTIVFRDGSGNFSAGTVTAALSGNATTATTWQTARNFTIGSTARSVNGSADVTWTLADIGAAAASHNHTSLTGVTSIGFAAEGSDSASISTTISSTQTFFDFNLTDDNNNDLWRWRFTPSGSTVYNAMTLSPSANGVSDLVVAGTITGTRLISNVATGTAPLTVASTTLVTNLNADLLDGLNSATGNTASTIVARDSSGNFSAGTITATLAGLATSETLSTVTGRGASTGSQISVATGSGGSMFTGTKVGSGYSDGVSGATFKSITDNPNGGSTAFAAYYGGSAGTNSFYVTAVGSAYFKDVVGIGTTSPVANLHVYRATNSTVANLAEVATYSAVKIGKFRADQDHSLYIGNAGSYASFLQGANDAGSNSMNILINPFGSNVGIGTTSPGYKLEVNGSFAATTKSFVIKHPTKEGKKLRYGSLEGPENGVYVRGKLKGSNVIELPDYWTKLVDPESITVQLTPIGSHQKLYVEKIEDNKVYIANENLLAKAINCFFYVLAERCDVEKLEVEIDA